MAYILYGILAAVVIFIAVLLLRAAAFKPKAGVSVDEENVEFDREITVSRLQSLIRYNDSTLRATEVDYGLAEDSLDPEKDWYDISLLVSLDKTPENSGDNLGNKPESVEFVRFTPAEVSAATHKGLHSYRRLIFNGVPMHSSVLAIYADFYFKNDIRYQAENFDIYSEIAYGTLCLYAHTEPKLTRPLTADEIGIIVK